MGRGDKGATRSSGTGTGWRTSTDGDDALRRRTGAASSTALREHLDAVVGEDGVQVLGAVVDAAMGARRLAAWSLWVELAAVARLVTAWKGQPPILDERLRADPCESSDPV